MKYLRYPLYQRGGCGWSNALMSVECGIVLAHLTSRFLVLACNNSPPANLAPGRRLAEVLGTGSQLRGARVTDLYEMPVRWIDAGEVPAWDRGVRCSHTWWSEPLASSVFYLPTDLDTSSADLLAFANGRSPRRFFTYAPELHDVDVLEMASEMNFSYYSYLFYLPAAVRHDVHRLLGRFRPKEPYRALAELIVRRLGRFNAVHIRLGDFRDTVGVTTRLRTPQHVVGALRKHFSPGDRLVICTDESRLDEFFGPIREVFTESLFLDRFVLEDDALRRAFLALPFHDDMAMALLTQQVAARAEDFIGSMTSTFTGIIQRMRGSQGRDEEFKFLWCEVPDKGDELKRGAHRFATTIPFEDNRFVETLRGPYSWNRLDMWVGAEYYAWFREWPEGFLPLAGGADSPDERAGRG